METPAAGMRQILAATALCFFAMEPPPALGKPPVAFSLPSPYQPKAPAPTVPGDGLCVAYRAMSDTAKNYFRFDDRKPQVSDYELSDQVNVLLDMGFGGPPRSDFTLRTNLDLSNRYVAITGEHNAIGDFNQTCDEGCPFSAPVPPVMEYFGNRFRGYLNVPQSWIGHDIYVAFRTDDAAYFQVFPQDGKGQGQIVITTGPEVGVEGLRITNKLQFPGPGLYPIEVGYAQLFNSAVLEWAFYTSASPPPAEFALPFESPSASAGSPTLTMWPGLQLAQPAWFFQSRTGKHPLGTADVCQQCPRSAVSLSGNEAGCSPGFFCNEAALCEPCQSNDQCGPSCVRCSGATPICDGTKCVECTKDAECGNGKVCRQELCVPCTADDACAGNSCNCCPSSMHCLKNQSNQYICGACQRDADCPGKHCDPNTLRCTDVTAACVAQDGDSTDRCSGSCELCPAERPHCLLGSVCVACRSDLECAQGSYCESGDCLPCVTDRRCGGSCRACPHDTPFCRTELGRADSARCVQCLDDSHCGPGGRCQQDGTCAAPCTLTCTAGTVCKGDQCVQCVSSSQCLCGETCFVATGECLSACQNNQDCLGSECCSQSTGSCMPGRCKSNLTAHGGKLCCSATAALAEPAAASDTGGLWLAGLGTLAMLTLLRRRRAGFQREGSLG